MNMCERDVYMKLSFLSMLGEGDTRVLRGFKQSLLINYNTKVAIRIMTNQGTSKRIFRLFEKEIQNYSVDKENKDAISVFLLFTSRVIMIIMKSRLIVCNSYVYAGFKRVL